MTQKYHRVENQFEKPSRMHEHPAGPAGTPRCALARPGARMVAVSWSGPQPCRGKGPAVSQAPVAVSQRPCRTPSALPPAPQRPNACSPRTLARSLGLPCARFVPSAVSWLPQRPCHGLATGRVATRLPAQPPNPLSQYTYCIAIQWPMSFKRVAIHLSLPKPLSTCNTTWCIAIQSLANLPLLQYNTSLAI